MKLSPAWVTVAMLVAALVGEPARADADREHQVKSAFVFDIALFCEWDSLGAPGTPFVVGLYKADSYGKELDDMLSGKSVLGHRVVVRRFSSSEDLAQCRIVVLGDVRAGAIRQLVDQLRNSGTLLVGEAPGFAESGGPLGFVVIDRNVHFEVNLRSSQTDHVQISSKLLKLATQVYR